MLPCRLCRRRCFILEVYHQEPSSRPDPFPPRPAASPRSTLAAARKSTVSPPHATNGGAAAAGHIVLVSCLRDKGHSLVSPLTPIALYRVPSFSSAQDIPAAIFVILQSSTHSLTTWVSPHSSRSSFCSQSSAAAPTSATKSTCGAMSSQTAARSTWRRRT